MADPTEGTETRKIPGDNALRGNGGAHVVRRHATRDEPVFWGTHWTSARPAAGLVAWGMGLLLAAGLPFFFGLRVVLNASMYSPSAGAAWFALSGLMNLLGALVLCIGIYRLARKADVAFLITQGRYLAAEKTHTS